MNSQYQVKPNGKEKGVTSAKARRTSKKKVQNKSSTFKKKFRSSGTTLLAPSNPRYKLEIHLQNTKSPFHLAPHTHREKAKGKSFF